MLRCVVVVVGGGERVAGEWRAAGGGRELNEGRTSSLFPIQRYGSFPRFVVLQ